MGYPSFDPQIEVAPEASAVVKRDEEPTTLTPAQANRVLVFQQAAKILKDANPVQAFASRKPITVDEIIDLGYAILGDDEDQTDEVDRPDEADGIEDTPLGALLALLGGDGDELEGSTRIPASALVVGQQMTRGGDLVTDIQTTADGDLSVTVRCEHGPGDPHDTTMVFAADKMLPVWLPTES